MAFNSNAKVAPTTSVDKPIGALPDMVDHGVSISTTPYQLWLNETGSIGILKELEVYGGVDNQTLTIVLNGVDAFVLDLKTKNPAGLEWEEGKELYFSNQDVGAGKGIFLKTSSGTVSVTYRVGGQTA